MASLSDELDGAYLYNALAQVKKDPHLAEVYSCMAIVERKHADEWVERLKPASVAIPTFSPNWRSCTLDWAAKRLCVAAVLPTVIGNEPKDTRKYSQIPGSAGMTVD